MKNINFGTKLLLVLISTVIISLGALIFFTNSASHKSAEKEAKELIRATVQKYANEQKAILNSSIGAVNAMKNRVETAIKTGENLSKAGMVEFQKNILKENDFLYTAWIGFADDSYLFDNYDGSDKNPYYTPKGVFQPLVTNDNGKFVLDFLPEFDKEAPYLKKAIELKRAAITEPYDYELLGKRFI